MSSYKSLAHIFKYNSIKIFLWFGELGIPDSESGLEGKDDDLVAPLAGLLQFEDLKQPTLF